MSAMMVSGGGRCPGGTGGGKCHLFLTADCSGTGTDVIYIATVATRSRSRQLSAHYFCKRPLHVDPS